MKRQCPVYSHPQINKIIRLFRDQVFETRSCQGTLRLRGILSTGFSCIHIL